jgi:6-oxo-cyclohex-1-ene-carbonyl-CoA hydrolase
MMGEAFLGFGAFNTKKITGQDVIDFIEYRKAIANAEEMNEEVFARVMGKPQK